MHEISLVVVPNVEFVKGDPEKARVFAKLEYTDRQAKCLSFNDLQRHVKEVRTPDPIRCGLCFCAFAVPCAQTPSRPIPLRVSALPLPRSCLLRLTPPGGRNTG